jgi:hypothetical protein
MFEFEVPMLDGSKYRITKLLAKGSSNTKTAKSDKAGLGYITKSLSLAPAKASGFNLCTSASKGCIKGCLYTAGYAMVHPRRVQPARIAKARMLRLYPEDFRRQLEKELFNSLKTANRKGLRLAVRLNVVSDVRWESEMPGLLEKFPTIQFYDYTKHYQRMLRYLSKKLPANYHLTFSWSGTNELQSLDVLAKGGNVATAFHVKYYKSNYDPLPKMFKGFSVIDGDLTDFRFLDPQGGYVIGLRAKGKAKKDFDSGFVIKI